jgi:hypothetical protein
MTFRASLALCLAAGSPAAMRAQEVFTVHYSWVEVQAGTINPATGPLAGNSIVDPGEGARIRLGVTALINGVNAVGQTTSYTTPLPGGIGTVRGIGSAVYDLIGDANGTTAHGAWGGGPGTMTGPPGPFNSGQFAGLPQPGGASVHGMGGAQTITPGQSASGVNNNTQLFRGVWTPSSFIPRSVHFIARATILFPHGEQNAVLLAYGLGTAFESGGGGEFYNYDLLTSKFLDTDFGQGLLIPIAPAPASIALFAAALIPWIRRKRRERP